MPYQINSSQLFLTYPQCNVPKEEALEALHSMFSIERYIVACEKHKNGDLHLHVYLQLKEAFRTHNPNFADLGTFHGNYQGCRSPKNVIKYCTKAEDYLANFDVEEYIKSKSSKKKYIGSELISGNKRLSDLVIENPELIYDYKKLKDNLDCFRSDQFKDERDDLPSTLPNTWGLLLPVDTDCKKCHYWFWSDSPNKGKTTFGNSLCRTFRAYFQCGDFTYWDVKRDAEILIFDEFKPGTLKYNTLNSICDGSFSFRVFMQGPIKLDIGKPLVIVLSNYSIEGCFPHMKDYIYARFFEFKL